MHLKIVTVDWPSAIYNSSSFQFDVLRPKGSYLLTPNRAKTEVSLNEPKNEVKMDKSKKFSRKQSVCINRMKEFEINREKVGNYLDNGQSKSITPRYQQFPKREDQFKNGNAFKFYLNSPAVYRHYNESISSLEKIHAKITEVNHKPSNRYKLRPSTGKARPSTDKTRTTIEPIVELLKKNQVKERPRSTAGVRKVKAKHEKCPTTPYFEPWETTEDKFMTEW